MKMSADTLPKALTEPQRKAILSTDESMSVVAGAGSGKTTVLVNRLHRIVGEDYSNLDRVLAITFTEKAAAELRSRLSKLLPPKHRYRLEGAWIGTFHSCQARILRQHAELLGLDPSFDILDENAAGIASREAAKSALFEMLEGGDNDAAFLVAAIDFKTAFAALEELLNFRWHARKAIEAPSCDDDEEKKIISALSRVYLKAEEDLTAYFARTGSLDFQSLEMLSLELLSKDAEILNSYRQRFKHILVDEFQDTNDIQNELVLKLYHPEMNKLFIVGDPRQSIYRFRGANVDCFAAALEKIKEHKGEALHLAHNFRSRTPIVSFVNSCQFEFSDELFGSLANDGIGANTDKMIAARKNDNDGVVPKAPVVVIDVDVPPKTLASLRRETEAKALASFMTELVQSGTAKFGDIVCLFQALTNVSAYESIFRRFEIPCRFYGGLGLLARQEVSDLISVLSFAADPKDETSLLCLLRSPLIGLSDDELAIMAGADGKMFVKNALADKRTKLLHDLSNMARHLSPSEILQRVIDETGYELLLERVDPSGGMASSVDRFIEMARSIESNRPTPLASYVDFIRELKTQGARLSEPPVEANISNSVGCMTVHAAKGREFPVVILPDLFRGKRNEGGNFIFSRRSGIAFKLKDRSHPFASRIATPRYDSFRAKEMEEDDAESKRLFYVAMTRARDMLVLPVHKDMEKDGKWHKQIAEIVGKVEGIASLSFPRVVGMPSSALVGGGNPKNIFTGSPPTTAGMTDSRSITRVPMATKKWTVSQLEAYEHCPQEYYLKHILGLPEELLNPKKPDELPANLRGLIVHGVLERIDLERTDEIENLIRVICLEMTSCPSQADIKTIRKDISAALKIPIMNELMRGEREVRFDWRLKNNIINGSIDWLRPREDGTLEIVDFKTDRIEANRIAETAEKYELQLVSYALAAEAATGKKVSATSLVFLGHGIVHEIGFNEERRNAGRARILKIADDIEGKNFKTPPSPPCIRCAYHHNHTCWEDRTIVKK